mmetsp:Transcript_3977/g.8958  ORF Transcript_3977/g.8958 Transcript_3977/m.8958 type:complete len:288 (+) Transcript_3977:119-982(+)|eukprot:CAMPEP_0168167318 /NCGR_PEP_ID=MMETSP0139_2-20121125/2486_1 /TAXON_ID=44445 /ORGANISM="Pseudo-nitzschia australis, Strain 10249 10 AB" /LENGTH=287 /DNA_ID=CAMNT_0008084553 /DNA_START=45 /DNA_END=908 /DNA_ORIENTATION=-
MADLYNLLDELEENEGYDDEKQDPRRLTVDTAATERLSDDDCEDYDDTAPTPQVPAALLEQDDSEDRFHPGKTSADSFSKEGLDIHDDLDKTDQKQYEIPNELYGKLQHHWLQERHCPELLKYDEEMVEELQVQFEDRQQQADDLVDSQEPVEVLMANLAQQDLDRAKFVLSDWLTHRLHKIESHPLHMREKIEQMSQNEIDYLAAYGAMIHHHLEQTVTHSIPHAWKELDDPEMIDQPDYEGYHFWLVRETIVDRDEIDHEAGSCLVAKYLDMKENMKANKVELLI